MTWIYFDELDRQSPLRDCAFESLEGRVDLRQYYGKCNLVLFFAHSGECVACNSVVQELSQHIADFALLDTPVMVIVPEQGSRSLQGNRNIHLLVDRGGTAKQYFVKDLYNADEYSAVLYVLDQYQSPYAALGDDELAVSSLFEEVAAWLNYIQIQCPE
jgi:hypothetical protein